MPATPLPLGTIALDADAASPLYRQLYDALREAILEGRLGPGARLPSSRLLAAELGVGRNTVLAAYDQLTAEGYLEGQVGAGTVVAATLPDSLLQLDRQAQITKQKPANANARQLSRRGQALSATRHLTPGYARGIGKPFQHGLPAIDEFPAMLWSRLLARHSRDTRTTLFGYETGTGVEALRDAIAAYAGAARGVTCNRDQVIVTVGAQGALDLAARMLLDPGDAVWVEDPGYLGARAAFTAAGLDIVPMPVDEEGADPRLVSDRRPPRLIYVTPSHQYPYGTRMSLARRAMVLDAARACGGVV
ncbi:MAG: PLP-dependent aminotransferase family protein, partial [Alphaproteobacteria bacterium]|nr:PLP-dependent aminotransferase family protein [Alphaproteobacteria bacterium]MDX5416186.1 PLP-dependent aminotransferase family protein [Alphaproteobacteria bacterium]MDX5493496.1 PLP-dependent aminotransferase family protein [Alphaproteobacteria bacterium]